MRRRPSPATVIAVIALVGAWGGPAVADVLISGSDVRDGSLSGRDIRNRSITGRDVHSNTITGRNVKGLSGRDILQDSLDGWNIAEERLSEVPRAAFAGTAEKADRATVAERLAGAAAGATPLRAQATLAAGSERQVLDAEGLSIRVRCLGAGQTEALASTAASGAIVKATVVRQGQAANYSEDDDFRIGDSFNLQPSGRGNLVGSLSYLAANGSVVTLDYFVDEGVTAATPSGGCVFAAHGLSSSAPG